MNAKVIRLHDDQLMSGFYTVRDAARLLKVSSPQKLRGWLCGHVNSDAAPIIQRTHQPIGKYHEISFLDLMEMRFIEHYRKKNIPLQTLRVAADNARKELRTPHPFALCGIRFMNERRKIFLETANQLGDKKLLNLITRQFEIYQVIEKLLEVGVNFDRRSGFAKQWHPDQQNAPHVYLNPHFAFGQPVVGDEGITTDAIFSTYQAEKGNKDKVAEWYSITPSLVEEAVRFEAGLAP